MSSIKIEEFVKQVLLEDIGRGDLFASLSPKKSFCANIISKEDCILSGVVYVQALVQMRHLNAIYYKQDGDNIQQGDIIIQISGDASTILECERTILNLLQHSSGIATNTNKTVKLLEGSDIKLLDTRKTRPLLREFEKYSTKVGGAINHRLGLDDCLMLKDTHLKTITNLKEFVKQAKAQIPWTAKIEIECETLDMAQEAMSAGADIIMCDNMNIETIKKVIEYKSQNYPHILIEISGNIDKTNIDKYKSLGIDAISSGSLIHQAKWVDLSMRFL